MDPIEILRQQLLTFARGLAAEQWNDYDSFASEDPAYLAARAADRARAETKADVGRALLDALGEGQS